MRQFLKYFISCTIIAVAACSSEDEKPGQSDRDYLPVHVGNYQIFTIDQTEYFELDDPVESHYELKMEVVESFPDVGDDFVYVVYRSTRQTISDPWEYKDTWSVRVNDNQVIINEQNTPYVQIKFPVKNERQWNGNEFNANGEDVYQMHAVGEPFTVGDQTFTNTIRIDEEDEEDLLFKDKRFVIFAKGVGLIYQEVTDLEYCDDVDCFGKKEIKKGIVYKQVITEYEVN